VIYLVSEEEIEQVAKLMKIEVDDHKEYIDKVHAMIDYFGILDLAGVDDEEILMKDVPLSSLRDDKHIPYKDRLIDRLKHYKGTYVRAPKMM
jgi:aspartyl-tRNA(Asn)/glutamyl-tRNA(Gln) amidotransferase subunit C